MGISPFQASGYLSFHRYKHNKKQIHYKRAISEQYSDYKHPNGLVERVVQYVDLECEVPSRKYEKFKNRADKLYKCDTNYENEKVQEYFEQGMQCRWESNYYKIIFSKRLTFLIFDWLFETSVKSDGKSVIRFSALQAALFNKMVLIFYFRRIFK